MATILIVENETAIRKLITQILRNAGYEVLASGSGEDALDKARKHRGEIDVLVADIVMPGMGGADVYAWLKSERPGIRVLFISGFMNRQPLPGAFLRKPFSAKDLLEKIRELLHGGVAGTSG
jgi:two-component system cell cycle sensor histidine kinase/response regulator CckA